MLQFNLLPDVKLEYIRAQRTKKLVMMISVLVTAGALAIFVLLFLNVELVQHQQMKNLDKSIAANTKTLKSKPDLDKILTIQNQLRTLLDLHKQKPAAASLFNYLPQLVPQNVGLTSVVVNFDEKTIEFTGSADSVLTVNKFADTLKFATYKLGDDTKETKTFKDHSVVLSSLQHSGDTSGKATDNSTNFTITGEFDPNIFDITQKVTLVVPTDYITTRSVIEQPNIQLFNGALPQQNQGSGQ